MIPFAFVAVLQIHDYYFGVATRGLIGWIIIGLLAGWIAGHLTRGRGFGCIVDVILGLIGAVLGGRWFGGVIAGSLVILARCLSVAGGRRWIAGVGGFLCRRGCQFFRVS